MNRAERPWFGAVLALSAIFALGVPGGPASGAEKVSVRLKWLHASQFSGIYAAQDKGWYAAEGLDVTINAAGPTLRPEPLVAAGTDTFGVSDTVTQIASRDKGIPVVQIATILQKNPLVVVTKKKSGPARLEDFKGKRLSVPFTGIQYQTRGVLRKFGVMPGSYTEVPFTQSVKPFVDDQVDAVAIPVYDEYLTIVEMGVTDLNVFSLAENGFNIPRDGIIVHEKTLAEKPDMVLGFLRATLRGWQWALENPKEAIDIVMKMNPNLTRGHQENQLVELTKLIKYGEALTQGLGYQNPKDWEFALQFMLENDLIKKPVDLSRAYTNEVWSKVPAEYRRIK